MAKTRLTLEDIDVTVTVPAGSRVIEISEKVNSGIVYGCREDECGACLMKVVKGWEHLTEPSVVEDKVLRQHLAGRYFRLACQSQALGSGIVVRPV